MRPGACRRFGYLLALVLLAPVGIFAAQFPDPEPRVTLIESTSEELLDDPGFSGASVPFGDAVALLPVNLHEPGVPYSVRIVTADGEVPIEREGRSILDVRALEHHLVIASRGTGAAARTLGEVIDEDGDVAWTFNAPGDVPPRVAVGDGRAVAVFPGREESIVEYRGSASPAIGRWFVADTVLTQAALSTTGDGILAWGPRQVVWIDADEKEIAWRAPVTGAARPLAATTSGFTPVGGTVALPVRERERDGAWRVELLLLDVESGRTVSRSLLHHADEMPAAFGRARRGDAERLAIRGRVYEVGVEPAERP